jgi:hypothetical protein
MSVIRSLQKKISARKNEMEINNRTHQISKSSVYYELKKMARSNVDKGQSAEIDLGRVLIECSDNKIQVFSEKYPKNKVILLEYNYTSKKWNNCQDQAGHKISKTIQSLVNNQIYGDLSFKNESLLVLQISIEVWIKIDSWAH